MDKKTAISLCMQHMHRYVCVPLTDGTVRDGIVESVDEDNLYLAVPTGGEERDARPRFGGFGYPFGYPYGFPYGYFPRRFYRSAVPLAALLALSLLPYF